jgi:hypothetical protein
MPGGPTGPTAGPAGTPAPVVSNTLLQKVPRDWLVEGFRLAHDRFTQASQDPQAAAELFAPLFETLSWAGVLEEAARKPQMHNVPELMAIRFVRDRVVHDWALAVEGRNITNPAAPPIRAAGRSQIIAPAVIWDWFWKPSQDLPQLKGKFATWRRKQDERIQYDAVFAGHPVRDSLEALRRIF